MKQVRVAGSLVTAMTLLACGGGVSRPAPPSEAGGQTPTTPTPTTTTDPTTRGDLTIWFDRGLSGGRTSNDVVSGVGTPGAGRSCTTTTAGACAFQSCTGSVTSTASHGPNAGTVTVTGDALSAPLVLSPTAAFGDYFADSGTLGAKWGAGALLHVRAAGSAIPAFALDVVATPHLVIDGPPWASAPLAMHRSTPLHVTWAPADGEPAAGTVVFVIGAPWDDLGDDVYPVTQPDGSTSLATCTFPVADGGGSVPSSILSLFPAGATVGMEVSAETRTTTIEDGWRITISTRALGGIGGDVTFDD